ncbi:MAG: hypothetical protein ACUVQ7_07660 [bacterium]
MKPLSLILLLAFCAIGQANSAPEEGKAREIALQKTGEFYLRKPSMEDVDLLRKIRPSSIFVGKGSIVLSHGQRVYFYDSKLNLIKVAGQTGLKPGLFPYRCVSATSSDQQEIVAVDPRGRINIYDQSGDLKRSLIVPDFNFSPLYAVKHGNLLIMAGAHWEGSGRIVVYDIKTARKVSQFFLIDEEEIAFLESRNALRFCLVPYLTVSADGHVLCNRQHDHRIFEYTPSGDLLHVYEEIPPHYVPFSSADPAPPLEGDLAHWMELSDNWLATWTPSKAPSAHGDDMFVVPRRDAAPYYLDFYSLSEKKYIGYCNLGEKFFMFSDSDHIYLCEDYSDTLVVVGRYTALLGEEPREAEQAIALSDSLVERVIQSISGTDDSVYSFEPKADFKVTDLDGEEHPFRDFLSDADRHFVFFIAPFEKCFFPHLYEPLRDFCIDHGGYALYLVVNHPYKEELEFLIKGLQLEARVVPNLNPDSVKESAPGYPQSGIILLNKDGSQVLASCSVYDLYGEDGKPIDVFLEEIANMDNINFEPSE